MSGSNRLGIKGTIASLVAAGTLCSGALGQGFPACDDPDPNAGDCSEETPGIPGCQSLECCNIVCGMDKNCCFFEWDDVCVSIALNFCPKFQCVECGNGGCNDCFVDPPDGGQPYCNNECDNVACDGCCETVCAADAYCCDTDWDIICAGEAMDMCSCVPEDAPANDDCADAIEIAEGVFPYSTLCGSQDGPSLVGTPCNDKVGGVDGVGIDVWYNYTASNTGPVRVHTCDVDASYDTQLAVYNDCACPADPATLVECNEVGPGCGVGSEIIFEAVAGACYKISVGGTFANTGNGTLIIEPLGIPANDDCASALSIGLNQTSSFFNFEATVDGSPSPVCDFGGENDIEQDVWYSFTSPASGTMQVNLCASTFDTKVAVYEAGACPPVADPIACDDDGCVGLQSLVEFDAVKGQTYLIRAGSRPGTGGGAGKISVTQFAICDVGGVVLLDQIGPDVSATTGQVIYNSQKFDAANDDADVAALDDFIVPDGPDLTLTCVDTVAGGHNGFDSPANITNYELQIYSSPEAAGMSLTGDVASLASVPVLVVEPFDADTGTFLLHMDLTGLGPPITLSPGTYWIAVIPTLDFAAGFGQTAISASTIDGSGNGPNGHQANPNGFWDYPNGFQQIDPPVNLAYRVLGDGEKGGTIGPDDFNAFRGFLNSGVLEDVLLSDDVDLCHDLGITIFPSEAPITLDFFGTLPTDSPATLSVTIESSANTPGLELTILMWNYNTNSWESIGTASQGFNVDTVRTFNGVPADHVEAGTGAVRTRYEVRQTGIIFAFPWTDCIDQLFWTHG